ncbi:hypothetical protein SPI_01466 [Niveomyces insectorum RCEF 264]|uniref:Uncharacterized protein n=1 Tax=Niveomyces insectorum RCEF 264 TaxID=1081102 RepID=A0A162MTW9_9HYPO|nr:hypothetical protein SPI_01466 [Niveomyces insectorum RCEF 264]
MQLTGSTALAAAVAVIFHGTAYASYGIDLYEGASCRGSIGHTCASMSLQECCQDSGTKYHSANFEESAGGDCSDQLKVYPGDGSDHCGGITIDQDAYPKCVSSSSKNIAGAKVWEVHSAKRAVVSTASTAFVEPDLTFFENGTQRWILARNTTAYAAFTKLTTDDDRINHLLVHGTLTERTEKAKCKAPKKGKKDGDKGKKKGGDKGKKKGGDKGKKKGGDKKKGGKRGLRFVA